MCKTTLSTQYNNAGLGCNIRCSPRDEGGFQSESQKTHKDK